MNLNIKYWYQLLLICDELFNRLPLFKVLHASWHASLRLYDSVQRLLSQAYTFNYSQIWIPHNTSDTFTYIDVNCKWPKVTEQTPDPKIWFKVALEIQSLQQYFQLEIWRSVAFCKITYRKHKYKHPQAGNGRKDKSGFEYPD